MQATLTDTDTDSTYDEGLVHGHGWACAESGSSMEQTIGEAEQASSGWREDAANGDAEGDAYDDGLVHDHGWASSR